MSMTFKEKMDLEYKKIDHYLNGSEIFENGSNAAKNAIIDLLMSVNSGNLDDDGEPLSDECRAEVETIDNLIHLIKHGNDYE